MAKPRLVTPPAHQNTVVLASATSAQRVLLPDSWRENHVTLEMEGVNGWIRFGDDTVVADNTAVTTLVSELPTTFDGGECRYVADGGEKTWDMSLVRQSESDKQVYASIICSATGGYIRLSRTSGPIGRNT